MTITLDALLQDIAAARQRMSRGNPHRLLLQRCAEALIQLAGRVGEHSLPQEKSNAPAQADPVGRFAQP